MECILTEKLYSYLDGELDEAEEQQIEAHLLSCRKCFSLAKRFEFESAVVAKTLRSEKVPRKERDRAIQALAKKRDWKLKEPLFFRHHLFREAIRGSFALSAKIVVILPLLLGMFVISYSVLMRDTHIEVGAKLSSDFPLIVQTDEFLSSASQTIRIANSIIGGMVPAKIALVFFILYIYFAGLLLLFLSVSVPALKARLE